MGNGLEWSKADDIEQVKRLVPRGAIVYAAQRRTKGSTRFLHFYAFPDGERVFLSRKVAVLGGYKQNKSGEVRFNGGNYSAVHEGVEALGVAVWGDAGAYRAEVL